MDQATFLNQIAADTDSLHLIFVGGVGEFGKNFSAYIYNNKMLIVDCGLMFADAHKLGVEYTIPQCEDLMQQFGGPEAYIITHGHEDHIGGLPHFLKRWPAPVYSTPWALKLLHDRLARHKVRMPPPMIEVRPGETHKISVFETSYVHMNHSIPMTCSVVIKAGGKKVFHTGDFKFDSQAMYEQPVNLDVLAKLGASGIDALVADSTNATHPGPSPSEANVIEPLEDILAKATGRVYLSTFSSNLWRLKSVIDICGRLGRRILPIGAGIRKSMETATHFKLIEPSPSAFITEEEARKMHENFVILVSGCQAEPRSTLRRMVDDPNTSFALRRGDTLILSSRIIPGNEKAVLNMIAQCEKIGVTVYDAKKYPQIHVSGHAYGDDITKLVELLKPKNFIPVHGTFSHLISSRNLVSKNTETAHCLDVENGSVVRLAKNGSCDVIGKLEVSCEYVDSWSMIPMTHEVLRERLKIGDSGMVLITGAYDSRRRSWAAEATFETFGLTFPQDFPAPWAACVGDIESIIKDDTSEGADQPLNERIRLKIRKRLTEIFVKKPVVISRICLV
jgi:ribonuclease J